MSPTSAGSSALSAASFLVPIRYPATNGFDIVMPAAATSVGQARRAVRAWCRYCRVPDDLIDTVLLIVSEMCTNAILYGRSDTIGVRVWMPYVSQLRIEVANYTPSPVPAAQHPGADAERGRGLFLVNALTTEAGGAWSFTADGTRAWCTLPLPMTNSGESLSTRVPQGSHRDPADPSTHP
ncbi:ATP-binding protein [Streptomyces sp. NPDC093223]|uniref:ATP-binding protein n=1 Tax=Streptomyces sp. NPDC093223 TaxID=3366033 RepID=UPI00380A58FE